MQSFLPSYDPLIPRKFSVGTIDQKIQNKTALQKSFGWPQEPKRPLLCLPAGMTDKLGGELFSTLLPGLLTLPVEILVLGKGSTKYGALFTKLSQEHGHRVRIMTEQEADLHRMYAASDMALFTGDPSDTEELTHCLRYGVVPVSSAAKTLSDYDPIQETGNAFIFAVPTKWHVFASLVRAMETYKFPFDWRTIQRHCMETLPSRERNISHG
jgi:starch synthase